MRTNEELIELYLKQLPLERYVTMHVAKRYQMELLETLPLHLYNKPIILILNN